MTPAWEFDDDLKHITAFLFVLAMWTPGVSAIALFIYKNNIEKELETFFISELVKTGYPTIYSTSFSGHLPH